MEFNKQELNELFLALNYRHTVLSKEQEKHGPCSNGEVDVVQKELDILLPLLKKVGNELLK